MTPEVKRSVGTSVGALRRALGTVLVVACGAVLMHACGGGSGAVDDSGGGNGGGGGGSTSLSGLLWHNDFGLDSVHGLQVSDLAGSATQLVNATETAVPTPDGLHYITYVYDTDTVVSTVTIRTRGSAQVVDSATFNGYIRRVRPSPTRLGDMLLTWASSAGGVGSDRPDLTFVDLPGRRILTTLDGTNTAADWLPDGRYVYIDSAGSVSIGTPGAASAAAGHLTVSGRLPAAAWVDPTGARMITRWVQRDAGGGIIGTDLWISAVDGSAAERLTSTGLTTYGIWSPDGAYFGFDHDTDSVCSSTGCSGVPVGGCDLYVAPIGGRSLTLSSSGVQSFTVADQGGRREVLGCDLVAWTR